jgi:hypothetical protein
MGTKIGVGIAMVALLVGCSTTTTGTGPAEDGDAGSSTSTGNDGIYGGWAYVEPDGSGATALSFGENGSYSFVILKEVTGSNSEGQEETGTFAVTDNTLVLSPEKYTCSGSDPTYEASYGLSGGNLSVTFGSTDIIFAPIPASSSSSSTPGLASGGEVTLGCFSTNGDFTMQALEPVGS